jgi:hypothetical protein
MIHAAERVKAIRDRVATQMRLLADLEGRVSDAYMRGRLKHVRDSLTDIETFFLESLSREERTPEAEAIWLSQAEMVLQMATRRLKSIQDDVAK